MIASAPFMALGTVLMVPAPIVLYVASGTPVTALTTAAGAAPLAADLALVSLALSLMTTNTPTTRSTDDDGGEGGEELGPALAASLRGAHRGELGLGLLASLLLGQSVRHGVKRTGPTLGNP